jgi:hypothetical protein
MSKPSEMRAPKAAVAAPILADKRYAALSAFTPENLLREAWREKGLATVPMPEVCVLDPDGDMGRRLRSAGRVQQERRWACYHAGIVDVGWALMEVRHVLRPGGEMRFVEHGLSPDPGVASWQNCLTPLWHCSPGGRHFNRKMDDLIRCGGFRLAALSTGYARGPRATMYMYEGVAT